METSKKIDAQRVVAGVFLSLSMAALEGGDAQGALAAAAEAQKIFAASRQQDSEWRAALVAALASRGLRQEEAALRHAAHASALLEGLQERLGAEAFGSFVERPDVAEARARLSREFR